jgi:hypothetical protein
MLIFTKAITGTSTISIWQLANIKPFLYKSYPFPQRSYSKENVKQWRIKSMVRWAVFSKISNFRARRGALGYESDPISAVGIP